MSRSAVRALVLLGSLSLLTGCPAYTTLGTARTLGKGHLEFQAEAVVQVPEESPYDTLHLLAQTPQIGLRYGFTEDLDLGFKLWLLGTEVTSKVQLRRAPTPDAGIDVALAPSASFRVNPLAYAGGSVFTAGLHLPLLIGFNLGGGHQLIVGPRLTVESDEPRNVPYLLAGGLAGIALKVGDHAQVLLEVSAMRPLFTDPTTGPPPLPPVQLGIALNGVR